MAKKKESSEPANGNAPPPPPDTHSAQESGVVPEDQLKKWNLELQQVQATAQYRQEQMQLLEQEKINLCREMDQLKIQVCSFFYILTQKVYNVT